jgi:glycosyltransferase involved in cell wall biosynthesis
MKIALVCQYPFLRPTKGVELRLNQIASILSELGTVWPVIVTRMDTDESRLEELRQRFGRVSRIIPSRSPGSSIVSKLSRAFRSKAIAKRGFSLDWGSELIEELQQCDAVWFHSLAVADSLGVYEWVNGIVDLDDLHSEKHRQQAALAKNVVRRSAALWRAWIWRTWERDALRRFHFVVVCSDNDKKLLDSTNVVAVANTVDEPTTKTARRPLPDRIGFIGTLEYYANQDAVSWFISSILPIILVARPTVRVRIAGNLPSSYTPPSHSNVDFLGYVNDLETEVATWSASVAPVQIGGGTRLKILDAFKLKCPVVSTSLGCYGLRAMHNREILIGDSPAEFATACLGLCQSPEQGQNLASAAYKLWQSRFTSAAIRPVIHELIESCHRSTGRRPEDIVPSLV